VIDLGRIWKRPGLLTSSLQRCVKLRKKSQDSRRSCQELNPESRMLIIQQLRSDAVFINILSSATLFMINSSRVRFVGPYIAYGRDEQSKF
jgi:hypothetical protein